MKLYNTLTRTVEDFIPLQKGIVTFYHCGPTVYWVQHIGNLRGMTMGDLLVRTLRYLGYEVQHVRNYTDVGHLTSDADSGEDKMEKGARREGLTPDQIAMKYIVQFEADTKALNLSEPQHKPRATMYVPDMIAMTGKLLADGYAYETDLAVYFDVSKFDRYTRLSRQNLELLNTGSGKAEVSDPAKRHPYDFALWFFRTGSHANALQWWQSPFRSSKVKDGIGMPGWHIECSAMSKALLGPTIDIHMGGVEHIPVHHTNEIAQSEAANGVPFVRVWMHNEHLVVENEKMAKSAGTGISVTDVVSKGFDPLSLRYFYLQAQYRSKQNFTWEALEASGRALEQLRNQVAAAMRTGQGTRSALSPEKLRQIDGYRAAFTAAVSSDLNIPAALAVVWDMLKSNIPSPDKVDLVLDFDQILGLGLGSVNSQITENAPLPAEIISLIQKRDDLRMLKHFDEADGVRKDIEARGYIVEDSPTGSVVRKA
jgi:cysteinyl-tRNA synthetase